MNYFELYGLPEQLRPDAAAVKSKYYELSRRYHPDRFTLAPVHERAEALQMAALNNDAYKTLSNTDSTMAYVLKLHHVLEEEEKYNLPATFLMEMMDLNEAVSEYEMDETNETLKMQAISAIEEQLESWESATGPVIQQFDAGDHSDTVLSRLKDLYFRKKYLLRIQQRVSTFAAR
ncbi:iron-sulfur cluster co-chaperone HscB C-terminal domain-containing protein [Chitinophagaceae bacterium MMS25-I14]